MLMLISHYHYFSHFTWIWTWKLHIPRIITLTAVNQTLVLRCIFITKNTATIFASLTKPLPTTLFPLEWMKKKRLNWNWEFLPCTKTKIKSKIIMMIRRGRFNQFLTKWNFFFFFLLAFCCLYKILVFSFLFSFCGLFVCFCHCDIILLQSIFIWFAMCE